MWKTNCFCDIEDGKKEITPVLLNDVEYNGGVGITNTPKCTHINVRSRNVSTWYIDVCMTITGVGGNRRLGKVWELDVGDTCIIGE